jgi:hypothetical protein
MSILFVSLRIAPDVDREPSVHPAAWRIIRAAAGAHHIVALTEAGSLRLTSPIRSINVVTRIAETESGRVYEIEDGPARDPETVELLMARPAFGLQGGYEDVSDAVWLDILGSSH